MDLKYIHSTHHVPTLGRRGFAEVQACQQHHMEHEELREQVCHGSFCDSIISIQWWVCFNEIKYVWIKPTSNGENQ